MREMNLAQRLKENGFADLGVIGSKLDSIHIAHQIGNPILLPGAPLVQSLLPRDSKTTTKNTYSGNYGCNEFPLHTDLAHWFKPPRYFALICKTPDPTVVTRVLDFGRALTGITLSTAKRALFKPRRTLENKLFLLRLLSGEQFRWDPLFLFPENNEAKEVSKHLNRIPTQQADSVILKEEGQVVIIDNWRTLHGRSSISNPSSPRLVERVYLSEVSL